MMEFDFHIGAQVHCTDGHCGKLVKVVVDPTTQRVTDLIVEKGFLLKHDRVLPVSVVERATEKDIFLNIRSNELERYGEYREYYIKEPSPDAASRSSRTDWEMGVPQVVPMIRRRVREGIATGKAVIERATDVDNLEKTIGHVDHILADRESGQITHLVMRRGLIPEHVVVPMHLVERVDEDAIFTSVTQEELKELPRYKARSDEEVLANLRQRLATSSEFRAVTATAAEGIVRLNGQVRSQAARSHAEELAREVEGVIEVDNALLVVDKEETMPANEAANVVAQVSVALATDPRTRNAVIEVIDDRGLVTLKGQVNSPSARQFAEDVAAGQPGVTGVVNELLITARN